MPANPIAGPSPHKRTRTVPGERIIYLTRRLRSLGKVAESFFEERLKAEDDGLTLLEIIDDLGDDLVEALITRRHQPPPVIAKQKLPG